VTRAWLLRRLVADARRHAGVWAALALAFALAGVCAAGARLASRPPAGLAARSAEPPAHVIAYLHDELPAAEVAELVRALSALPEVEGVRTVSAGEGLERLRGELGARAAVLEGVGPDLLFPSLEIAARPAAASALAFRLRRLGGVAEADLVPAPAPAARRPEGLDSAPARVALAVAGLAALLALVAALAFLRARLRGELAVLLTFGFTRAACARPALALAAAAGALGAAAGVLGARAASRVWLGLSLPPREAALGVAVFAVFAVLAVAAALGSPRPLEAAHAR
jgi:cell division protein FtsX